MLIATLQYLTGRSNIHLTEEVNEKRHVEPPIASRRRPYVPFLCLFLLFLIPAAFHPHAATAVKAPIKHFHTLKQMAYAYWKPEPAGFNYLANTTRPFFLNLNWDNPDMPINRSLTPCPILLGFTDDDKAADLIIKNVYSEVREGVDHKAEHWQPAVLFDMEERDNSGDLISEIFYNITHGLKSWYNFRWTYEFDAPLTYTYYMVSQFKDLRMPPIPFNSKLPGVVAADITTNCAPGKSRRNEVIDALHKLLPGRIYSYGPCSHNREIDQDVPIEHQDGDRNTGAWQYRKFATIRRHKFVFAFENTNAVDYASEKLWHALAAGAVPVVLGPPNIRENFLPHPKAAILASEFETVKDLAEHLEYLANNETAYNEHLAWKTQPFNPNFQAILDYEDALPPLCRVAMLAKGNFTNPLNKFKTREKFGDINVRYPTIFKYE